MPLVAGRLFTSPLRILQSVPILFSGVLLNRDHHKRRKLIELKLKENRYEIGMNTHSSENSVAAERVYDHTAHGKLSA